MKNIKVTFWGLVVLVFTSLLIVSGCKKKQCYHCYHFNGAFFAIKGNDTISIGFLDSRVGLQDSINHYMNLGYAIDTYANSYFPDPLTGAATCGDLYNVYGSFDSDSCIKIKNTY